MTIARETTVHIAAEGPSAQSKKFRGKLGIPDSMMVATRLVRVSFFTAKPATPR